MANRIAEIHSRMLAAIDDGYDKQKGTFPYDVTMPTAMELALLAEKAEAALDCCFADTATGADLDRKCIDMGVTRKPAHAASGSVAVTGVAGARVVKNELVTSDTASFLFLEDGVVPASGTLQVAVICSAVGAAGNIPAGAIKSFPKTLEGLRAVTNTVPFINGYDAESDDSLRERYYTKVRTPATSGNKWHYLGWAKEVTGVGDARVEPLKYGNGTVGITVINANRRGADKALVTTVAAHIEEMRPIGATVTVESAAELPITLSVTLTVDTGSTTTELVTVEIVEAVTAYLFDIALRESYVSYARIGGLILNCAGVVDYSLLKVNGGIQNVIIPENTVAVMGDVSIA